MERILLRNGIPEPMPRIEGTYLYQTLHVRGRRPLWCRYRYQRQQQHPSKQGLHRLQMQQ